MQNQQWNNIQGNSPQAPASVPSVYMNQPYAPAMQSVPTQVPQYQEEHLLFEPLPQQKKGRPVLRAFGKSVGLVAALAGLFCMSALAGMMSEGKSPYLALFKKANTSVQQQGEVKGESTTVASPQYSGLSVSRASEVGQADPTNDNYGTLTSSSPFYQYVDTLGSDQITVARQPLPDEFNGNPANLQSLAARIGANQPFSTDKWGTAYMMTSGDVQVVAIANNKHIVFLRSTQLHSKDEWKKYIDTFTLR